MGFSAVMAEIGQTVFLSIYGAISALQYPRVYMLGFVMLGILQGLTSLRIQVQDDYTATGDALIDIDNFIVRTVNDTNTFIQETPNELIDLVELFSQIPNNAANFVKKMVTRNANRGISTSLLTLQSPIQTLINRVCPINQVCSFTAPSIPQIPDVPINIPGLTIPPLNLSDYVIPYLPFSFNSTFRPIVDEAYGSYFIVLDVLCIVAYIITFWALLPVLRGFFRAPAKAVWKVLGPKIGCVSGPPSCSCSCAASSLRVFCTSFWGALIKSRVWLPMLIGAIAFLVGSLLVLRIDQAESEIARLLQSADNSTAELIDDANFYIGTASNETIDWANDQVQAVDLEARIALYGAESAARSAIQGLINSARSSMASQLSSIGVPVPPAAVPFLSLDIPRIPRIPYFPELLIPRDLVQLESWLTPFVIEVLKPGRDVGVAFAWVGVALFVVPILTLVCTPISKLVKSWIPTDLKKALQKQQKKLATEAGINNEGMSAKPFGSVTTGTAGTLAAGSST